MQRRQLVVGDPPARGGRILPYTPPFTMKIMGHQVAIIGGRVRCEACGSIGIIAKAGGPRRMGYITEVALEGDLCVCQCPEPQPLVSTLQSNSSFDDGDFGGKSGIPLWKPGIDQHLVASKVVDEQVKYPAATSLQTENICPNMTNETFAQRMMELRDEAVELIGLRLGELERWDQLAKDRILEWFGDPGLGRRTAHLSDLRPYLATGIQSLEHVLRGLQPKNFVRWSPTTHEHVGCVNPAPDRQGVVAQVCKPDTKTRTIAILSLFCGLRRTTRIHGTHRFYDNDSQLQTLIHEATHFADVFNSTDDWYGMRKAKEMLHSTGDFQIARANADSIVGYIMGAER
jgi:hypothetical protein